MKPISNFIFLLIASLVIALVSSVILLIDRSPVPERVPVDMIELFSDCEPPCFQGVLPGRTSITEAKTAFQASPVLSVVSSSPTHLELYWESNQSNIQLNIYINGYTGGRIENISFNQYQVQHRLMMEDMVKLFGPPDMVVGYDDGTFCSLNSIVYRDQRITAYMYYRNRSGQVNSINALDRLNGFSFVSSSEMSMMLSGQPTTFEWNGFTSYCQ